ncbi:MAG TPA: SDR family NAD(P)-dependent oxidoreductase [Stellaceae bacterium]|nr:SDR family NAD(P)-dependent oxidoreductase [Stellaceae bacterium]
MKSPASILISGASNGIGAALAETYAAPGKQLALGGRDVARLSGVAERCRQRGAVVVETIVDVTDAAAVADWVEGADRTAPLDLVIANAGIQGGSFRGGAGETLDEAERVMRVNFDGACNTVYPALGAMRPRRRGQIALVASLAGLRGFPYSPGYCASKAALKAYGEALRSWLGPEGIEIAVVLPGFVDTRMAKAVIGPKPLMMSADRAARIIQRGLARGRRQIAFPFPLYVGMQLLRALPAALADRLLRVVEVDISPYE